MTELPAHLPPHLPEGIVTFLFTDVEGSTALWEEAPDTMMRALEQHDSVIDGAASSNSGVLVRPRGEGDSRFVVFADAIDAVTAAAEVQRNLAQADWATPEPIVVRMALHTGASDLQGGDYYGTAVNRAARLRGVAHGGQTLISRATCELVRDHLPAGVTIRDLGEHSLRDLTRPEHVFQIDIEGLPDAFKPLASLNAVPNNLPVQLTDFVGRERELEEAKRIIVSSRLLTILAPGGAGKTRLAIQAAADLATSYPDGAFFVDLAPVESSSDIAQTTAESIGVSLASDEDLETQLLAHLAHEHLLLIFDNFEHLADGANIVSDILTAAPGVKVIATTRTKLNVTGETVLSLSGLDAHQDGVHLFVDAATRADAAFSLHPEDEDALERVLQLVEGMPLGILMAAAWVDTLRIEEIAGEIEKSLDFLETEVADTPDRHQSMRAVFDYTWSLLSEDERTTFAALSVFRGGFTREAAEEIAGASLRGLANLVGKSLIVADRDSGRYHVHELLRQYAEEELAQDQGKADTTIVAHNAFFAGLGAQVEVLMMAGEEVAALDLVEADLGNVRQAWRKALERGDAVAARSLLVGLWFLYEIRGWSKAGAELFAGAGDAFATGTGDAANEIAWALITSSEAKYLASLGEAEAAAVLADDAVTSLRPLSDPFAMVMALEVVGEIKGYLGDFEGMLAAADEAIQVADDAGHEMWSAGMKNYQALAHLQMGNSATALRLLQEGDAVLARLGEQFMRTWNLAAQAIIAMMADRVADAIALHRLQAELAGAVEYLRAEAVALQGLGNAQARSGDLDAADRAFLESLGKFDQMGLVPDVAALLVMIARVWVEKGRPQEAVEILASVLADPSSDQMSILEQIPINEAATGVLEPLEAALDPDRFAAAHARGTALSLDVVVKALLAEPR